MAWCTLCKILVGLSRHVHIAQFGLCCQPDQTDAEENRTQLVVCAGGSAVASDTIYREVLRLKEAGKPVIVSMGNVAASGGYYISAPATKIVAQPSTVTGSIGVVSHAWGSLAWIWLQIQLPLDCGKLNEKIHLSPSTLRPVYSSKSALGKLPCSKSITNLCYAVCFGFMVLGYSQ